MSNRIAPRFFRGIVDGSLSEYTLESMKKSFSNKKSGENLYIPIYDLDGSLLWPKKMSYERVKRFIAERDKKKQEEKHEI